MNDVSEDSTTTADYLSSAPPVAASFQYDGTNSVKIDDYYLLSGASSSADRLGPSEVYKYQNLTKNTTATPDSPCTDDLTTGSWDDAGETPLNESAVAIYTADAAGAVDVDLSLANDDRILGTTIVGAKMICRMKRAGGNSADHRMIFGEGTTPSVTNSADLNPKAGYLNYEYLTEGGEVPTSTQVMRLGFDIGQIDSGGQDFDCAEMGGMLLVTPNAPDITALSDTDLEYPDQNYFVGPFEI